MEFYHAQHSAAPEVLSKMGSVHAGVRSGSQQIGTMRKIVPNKRHAENIGSLLS